MIIVRLMQREMGRGVFIVEHQFDGCSLYVVKMGKVTLDSCCMTLNNRPFNGGRGRKLKNTKPPNGSISEAHTSNRASQNSLFDVLWSFSLLATDEKQ